jgi:diadenosine tetraphosphate (Ap4A) HIT family hydrolase
VRVSAESCFICDKHRSNERPGFSIFENDLVYAGHVHGSDNEIYLGHVIVEPKRHVEGLAALTAQEAGVIGQTVSNLAEAMRISEGVTQVSSFVFGDGSERHLHVHVVPRYPATPDDFHLLQILQWSGAPRGGADEVRDICARLRTALAAARGS